MQPISRLNASVKIPRSFWFSAVFSIIYTIAIGGLLVFNQQLAFLPPHLVDTLVSLSSFLGFALSWVGIKRSHWKHDRNAQKSSSGFHRFRIWVPFIFSMALVFQCLGMNLHSYYNAQHLFIFPSWADAAILGTYPLLLFGLLCFPTQSLPGKTRLSVLLNSSLIIVSVMAFSWYFLLGPLLFQQTGETALTIITHLAFPGFDLLLISYIVLFIAAAPGGPLRFSASIFSLALIIFALTDSIFQYQLLQGVLLPGYIVLGWVAGIFLLALTVQSIRWLPAIKEIENTPHTTTSPEKPTSVWQPLLPYVLVPGVFGLVFYIWSIGKTSPLANGTYSLSLTLLALIFVKQIVAIREIHWLNRKVRVANDRLEALATTDPLTELPNHRSLMAALGSELERAQRYHRSCTVLFFDLDHFKALNDGYGHSAGDEALFAFGTRLRQSIRSIDTVGRWGGEEFIAILPETTVQEASEIAERIRTAVSQKPFAIGGGIHLTCSIGLASYSIHATTLNDLVNAADQAMYAAKRLGRNQLRCIDDPAVQVILTSDDDGGREEAALHGIIDALISMVQQRDPHLGDHSEEVAGLVQQLAVRLGVPTQEAHMMYLAGKLHDIGKIGIPDAILGKTGHLTTEEWQQIKKHPEAGAEIITHIPTLRPLAPAIRAHHERWDGTGYPDQLSKEEIPLAARIIAAADAYMAMILNRPDQLGCSPADALRELQSSAGTKFDPIIIETLAALLYVQASKEEAVTSIA